MAAGDHLMIRYGSFDHHGIDIGDGTVVHLSKEKFEIRRVPFQVFRDGRDVWFYDYTIGVLEKSAVVEAALKRVGQRGYNLLVWNCEHFAFWCKTGVHRSYQVRFGILRLCASGSKGAVIVGAKSAAKATSVCGLKAIGRSVTPWLLASDALQVVTEMAAAGVGAPPEKAKNAGRCVGCASSVGIGFLAGGPVGAGVGFGLWIFGECVGLSFIS
jgi:hypothetical protein